MYSLDKIKNEIRQYRINQIIKSGENDMFDNKINVEEVKKYLLETEIENDDTVNKIDLNKTLCDIENDKLFESIINLKNKHVG